jgi:hypothetical protein
MKQLKLELNPKKVSKSATFIFKSIKEDEIKLSEFFEWLQQFESKAYGKGYKTGYAEGTSKERYQGEFGSRSNY